MQNQHKYHVNRGRQLIIKAITHPLFIIIYFMLLIINGENVSSLYCKYLLSGNLSIKIYSIIGNIGWSILLLNFLINSKRSIFSIIVNLIGFILIVLSIVLFFYADTNHYGYYTFSRPLPLLFFSGFISISILFMFRQLRELKSLYR